MTNSLLSRTRTRTFTIPTPTPTSFSAAPSGLALALSLALISLWLYLFVIKLRQQVHRGGFMRLIFSSIFLLIMGILVMNTDTLAGNLNIDASFSVPIFQSNTPTNFTDICYDNQTKKLALCSDGGYGEFPIVNGKVQFSPPGFIAATGNFIIRGYTNTPAGLSAVDNRGKFVFWGKSGRLQLPVDVGTISGMAWDGKRLWIARKLPARLFAFRLESGNSLVLDRTVDFSFPILQSVTFHNNTLWITDGKHIFRLNKRQQILETWAYPQAISGFCFAGGVLYAVSLNGHTIYRSPANRL